MSKTVFKTYKFRLWTKKQQETALSFQLSEACRLYNAALQERRDAWRLNRISINYFDQAGQLKDIRANDDSALANYSCSQDVLRRVDKTFKAFFNRVKRGEKGGFPRFKSTSRFDSITFPKYGDGIKLIGSKLRIQGVGLVKVKLHREIKGVIKTVTIQRNCGKWFVIFAVECEAKLLPKTDRQIGLDAGIESFITLSNGTHIENFKYFESSQSQLRKAQRKVSRRKKDSHRRKKAVSQLQKIHAKIKNQRSDFHHKTSRALVDEFDLIAIEKLNIKGLSKGFLSKQVADAAWGNFFRILKCKAEDADRAVIEVNPNGTSQTCLCGATVKKDLSIRWHRCETCGVSEHRDVVSAKVILNRALGLSVKDITYRNTESVSLEAACF